MFRGNKYLDISFSSQCRSLCKPNDELLNDYRMREHKAATAEGQSGAACQWIQHVVLFAQQGEESWSFAWKTSWGANVLDGGHAQPGYSFAVVGMELLMGGSMVRRNSVGLRGNTHDSVRVLKSRDGGVDGGVTRQEIACWVSGPRLVHGETQSTHLLILPASQGILII